jgi:thiol-disulfide isomerase/thioredoxin
VNVVRRLAGLLVLAPALAGAGLQLVDAAQRVERLAPAIDVPLPEGLALPLVDGSTWRPRGKVVVMTFWATWCIACRQEMPTYRALHEDLTAIGVDYVLADREAPGLRLRDVSAAVGAYVREHELRMPVAVDTVGLYERLRARLLPHTVIIDRQGIVRRVHPGRVLRSTILEEARALAATPPAAARVNESAP